MRIEKDMLGELTIPEDVLYGIHSLRAKENFPDKSPFHPDWYKAVGKVKLVCYQTYDKFKNAVTEKHPELVKILRIMPDEAINALSKAAFEVSEGLHYDNFIVPAVQGGAGTSINLNINEIICNRGLQILGKKPGEYEFLHPIESANIYQSTNDVIPTSLSLVIMEKLNILEGTINDLRSQTESLETRYRNSLRLAYTQLQPAIPSTWGSLFSTYSDMLSRDWWRVSKCFERIKQVNLGGGAIGTGLSIPRYYIMEVVPALKKLTGLPITQAENLCDATSNLDSFVEVHAILKTHAVNLEKMAGDLRLLSSGLNQPPELKLPEKQTGSSIMPGKINPVIPEYIISASHEIYSNDQLITQLAAQGQLELNAYIPSIGNALLKSLDLLISMNQSFLINLLSGIEIDIKTSKEKLMHSPAITLAIAHIIGYNQASELAKKMKDMSMDIIQANKELKVIDPTLLKQLLMPEKLLKKGFTMSDLHDANPNKKV